MKVYQFTYSVDAFMDGRMDEDIQLFSSLENAFEYVKLAYNKEKKDFEECSGTYSIYTGGEWDNVTFHIFPVKLDTGLKVAKKEAKKQAKKEED